MTRQKSFKGRVRARMDKTAESYTTARRRLLAKASSAPEAAPEAAATAALEAVPSAAPGAAPDGAPEIRRPYSDEVIRRNTGRDWDQWFALLDEWGAAERPHPEIARWIAEAHAVPGWWAQGVTVAYEQARGRRVPGQRCDGDFSVSASKTVAVPVGRLFEAFADQDLRERWLPDAAFELRTAKPGRSLRAKRGGRLHPGQRQLHRPRRRQEPGRGPARAPARRRDGRDDEDLLARAGRGPEAGPGGLTAATGATGPALC